MSGLRRSPNYTILKKKIDSQFKTLEDEHFSKWVFLKHRAVSVKYLSGKEISYEGVGFDGSTRNVFWSDEYIPEYIKNFVHDDIYICQKNSKEYKLQPNKCFDELLELIIPKLNQTYKRMANIDARLRGGGHNIPEERDISGFVKKIKQDIESYIDSFRLSCIDSLLRSIENYKVKYAVVISIILGILTYVIEFDKIKSYFTN